MPHPNDLIIRKKLQEIKNKAGNSGHGITDRSLDGVTIRQLASQIEDLLDDRPRPLYVGKETQ